MRFTLLALSLALLFALPAGAADAPLVDEVRKGCATELDTWCRRVHPGQGRLLACLYAHGDKLSGQCEYALYDAAVQLERAVGALAYVANECDDDIDRVCGGVAAGNGNLVRCLKDNARTVQPRCTQALKDVGL